ncbi:flagellar hook-associated protein FlgK [Demequina sp. NBRC 110054]|uniref:flagellar hook-associated protein FlgK n=1 Tax=Demequina sp. NBRC 110054 TaxID=1570343 RepID=UPI0009FF3D1E|nr:flagellar hook-associated protein FlgK [Demequina sp. NBRC 110054]
MSSTFSGLSTAYSSLVAQRQALEVAGQNIANANTEGYTRQRVSMSAVSSNTVTSLWSSSTATSGNGVTVASLERLSDQFLDSRLRTQTASAAQAEATASTLESLESVVADLTDDTGITTALSDFWNAWQDVANAPDSDSARTVLLGTAETLTIQMADAYNSFESLWDEGRTSVDAYVTEVNTTAATIADLNEQIRGITTSGGSANELIDQRDLLITQLSELTGATAVLQDDGTANVFLDGNMLVQGNSATEIVATGSYGMAAALAEPVSADAVSLQWANGNSLTLDGGTLAGVVASLQPTSEGGSISAAVDAINDLATRVADQVNAIHAAGYAIDGTTTGNDFFAIAAGTPAALGISVAISDTDLIAAGDGANGEYDGSIADAISQLSTAEDGPDSTWQTYIVDLGVATASARTRADSAEATRATAESQQLANASVDIDEEVTNMVAYQRAYEAASRVMTAMDEMLDTLINSTGLVGR